jgi:hypothetical protein
MWMALAKMEMWAFHVESGPYIDGWVSRIIPQECSYMNVLILRSTDAVVLLRRIGH